jgi:hypothetical protein
MGLVRILQNKYAGSHIVRIEFAIDFWQTDAESSHSLQRVPRLGKAIIQKWGVLTRRVLRDSYNEC